jgi:rhodanese-related sulfurtransferase
MAAISPRELTRRIEIDPKLLVLDLRDPHEFEAGTIAGATSVPYDGIASVLGREVDHHRPMVLLCGWGHRSAIASIALKRVGFKNVVYLEGGLECWGLSGLPIVPGRHAGSRPLRNHELDRRAAAAGELQG